MIASLSCLIALSAAAPTCSAPATPALTFPAPAAPAQKPLDKSKPLGDPANDPYTKGGDPELMKAAGYVSMGGFEFGPAPDTTVETNKALGYLDIRWIETKHFEIGVALPQAKVTGDERDKIRAELTEMQAYFEDINPKTRILDPWLRAHLYAKRVEETYADVQEFLGVTDEDFADNDVIYNTSARKKYMGIGPHLGQLGKYEILFLPSEGAAVTYLKNKLGLTTKLSQRWNIVERETEMLVVHIGQGRMKVDESLHGHTVFNIVHLLLNGYKHYSYELPVWATEGVAHWFERKLNPKWNTFDSAEGAAAEMTKKADWTGPVKKMISSKKAPSFPALIGLRTFAEFELEHHYATWSIVDFLMTAHPEFLPHYMASLSGMKDANGYDDNSEMANVQRQLFKEKLGMSYSQFETAWKEWVAENY